jgi:hypothetical protein
MDIGTPRTAAYDMDGQELILDADSDTSITADTDDRIDCKAGGIDALRIDATVASPVNGLDVVASATGSAVGLTARGSDTNIGITATPKGTGAFTVTATTGSVVMTAATILLDASTSVDIDGAPLILDADGDSNIRETADDIVAIRLQAFDAFQFDGDVASPVNGLRFHSRPTNNAPIIEAHGSDSIIDLLLSPKSTGVALSTGGWAVNGSTDKTWRWQGSGTSILLQENTGTAASPTWTTRNTFVTGSGIPTSRPLLNTYSPSGAASVDIASQIVATYNVYEIELENIVPATDNAKLILRTDSNNGASFDAGASDYGFSAQVIVDSVSGTQSDQAHTSIIISGQAGNDTNEGVSGLVRIMFLGSATRFPAIKFDTTALNGSSETSFVVGGGHRRSAAAINAVQLLMDSGNITSGTIRIYGVTKTA